MCHAIWYFLFSISFFKIYAINLVIDSSYKNTDMNMTMLLLFKTLMTSYCRDKVEVPLVWEPLWPDP